MNYKEDEFIKNSIFDNISVDLIISSTIVFSFMLMCLLLFSYFFS
ncbi:hypothetical protein SH2C18_12490 [Clostridium sediminicola]